MWRDRLPLTPRARTYTHIHTHALPHTHTPAHTQAPHTRKHAHTHTHLHPPRPPPPPPSAREFMTKDAKTGQLRDTGVRFADIAGMEGIVFEMREVVKMLLGDPVYARVGARCPRVRCGVVGVCGCVSARCALAALV